MDHALLSASGASRWLACTPSAILESSFPNVSSIFADEGTLAHRLGELMIRHKLSRITKEEYDTELAKISSNELFSESMADYCDDYAVFVIEKLNGAGKDAVLLLEQKLDLSAFVPKGFGTSDSNIIGNGTLEIVDLKYGKGVAVDATENRQMMLYGLGALMEFDTSYTITKVVMTIYQPRISNFSTFEMPVKKLLAWGNKELRPKAKIAFEGKGEYVAGSHCKFCRARGICKANAVYNLEITKHDFKDPALMSDDDVSDVLTKADVFSSWLTAVGDYALNESVNRNKKWPNFKLVAGRSNRKYTDESTVITRLFDAGYDEDSTCTKKLLGITALEKKIGVESFKEIVSEFIIKPDGKPTLVPISDKRPEFHSSQSAATDFS